MEFFEKIDNAAKTVTGKVEEKIEETRLNGKIRSEELLIEGYKAELGARYWEKLAAGTAGADPDFHDITEKISASLAAIEGFKAELIKLEEEAKKAKEAAPAGAVCAKCGAALASGVRFCTECGTPAPVAPPPAAAAKRFCTNCGTQLLPDARFCPECGTKA